MMALQKNPNYQVYGCEGPFQNSSLWHTEETSQDDDVLQLGGVLGPVPAPGLHVQEAQASSPTVLTVNNHDFLPLFCLIISYIIIIKLIKRYLIKKR